MPIAHSCIPMLHSRGNYHFVFGTKQNKFSLITAIPKRIRNGAVFRGMLSPFEGHSLLKDCWRKAQQAD